MAFGASNSTTVSPVRRRRRRFRQLAVGMMTVLLSIAVAGAGYESSAEAADRRAFPPPGRLVDVGGHLLHIHCVGEGRPTVVLEGAMFAFSASWAQVQPELARHTRVCAYDRAGMGWSESGPGPRDAGRVAAELHTLLREAGESGPHVLVGHSLGALPVRILAARHPESVAGLVLLEATHPDVLTRLPAELATRFTPSEPELQLIGLLARVGVVRWRRLLVPDLTDLPPDARATVTALNVSARSVDAITAELRAIPDSLAQARAAAVPASLPLVVLSAAVTYPHDAVAQRAWRRLQQDLGGLSAQSATRTVPGTTHDSLVYSHDGGRATVDAVRQLVTAVRADRPLPRR
jgi:pimeloyl-ACP methyl ester carboxylesterase